MREDLADQRSGVPEAMICLSAVRLPLLGVEEAEVVTGGVSPTPADADESAVSLVALADRLEGVLAGVGGVASSVEERESPLEQVRDDLRGVDNTTSPSASSFVTFSSSGGLSAVTAAITSLSSGTGSSTRPLGSFDLLPTDAFLLGAGDDIRSFF